MIFLMLGTCWLPVFPVAVPDRLVFTYKTDRGVDARIYLAYEEGGLPDYYYCDLKTPICLENLCNPIEIRLEWDLLGNFRNYHEKAGKEITKFDHEPFEEKDHTQLKAILSDRESLLQDYRMEDLVDTTKKVYSSEIDGLTAATSTTFADKLVPGAIYTCYTLWHLVNGEISGRIGAHTAGLLTMELRKKMLRSGITVYEDYVLDGIGPGERNAFAPDLVGLAGSGNRFIAVKAVRKLPEAGVVREQTLGLVREFDRYDFPVQSAIIQYFAGQECDAGILDEWVGITAGIKNAHKTGLYRIFELNRERLTDRATGALLRILEQKKGGPDSQDRRLMVLLGR